MKANSVASKPGQSVTRVPLRTAANRKINWVERRILEASGDSRTELACCEIISKTDLNDSGVVWLMTETSTPRRTENA